MHHLTCTNFFQSISCLNLNIHSRQSHSRKCLVSQPTYTYKKNSFNHQIYVYKLKQMKAWGVVWNSIEMTAKVWFCQESETAHHLSHNFHLQQNSLTAWVTFCCAADLDYPTKSVSSHNDKRRKKFACTMKSFQTLEEGEKRNLFVY